MAQLIQVHTAPWPHYPKRNVYMCVFYAVIRSTTTVVTAVFYSSSEVSTSKRWSVSIINSAANPSTGGLVSCSTSSMATVYQDVDIIRKLWYVDICCLILLLLLLLLLMIFM